MDPLERDLARVFPVHAAAHPVDPDRYAGATLAYCTLALAEKTHDSEDLRAGQQQAAASRERDKSGPSPMRCIWAGIAACEEDSVRAVEHLTAAMYYDDRDAAAGPDPAYRLGELQPTPRRALREKADQWIRPRESSRPPDGPAVYAPGFAKISGESIETTY